MKFLLRGVFVMGAALGLRSLLAAKEDEGNPTGRDQGADKSEPTATSDISTDNDPPPNPAVDHDRG